MSLVWKGKFLFLWSLSDYGYFFFLYVSRPNSWKWRGNKIVASEEQLFVQEIRIQNQHFYLHLNTNHCNRFKIHDCFKFRAGYIVIFFLMSWKLFFTFSCPCIKKMEISELFCQKIGHFAWRIMKRTIFIFQYIPESSC